MGAAAGACWTGFALGPVHAAFARALPCQEARRQAAGGNSSRVVGLVDTDDAVKAGISAQTQTRRASTHLTCRVDTASNAKNTNTGCAPSARRVCQQDAGRGQVHDGMHTGQQIVGRGHAIRQAQTRNGLRGRASRALENPRRR